MAVKTKSRGDGLSREKENFSFNDKLARGEEA